MIDMFTAGIGGSFVVANGINDAGEVVGAAAFSNNPFAAAMWRNGVVTNLGVLPGDCFSEALVINSRGQVAGGSFPCDFSAEHAFLWDKGTIFDLTALISPKSTAQMVEPNAINDRGEIAGDGLPAGCTDFTSCSQAYVLIPCDDGDSSDGECGDHALREEPRQSNVTLPHQNPIIVTEPALSSLEKLRIESASASDAIGSSS
jgi:probable HAF family extracellular repeat protein